jgi:predicted HD phosphohydrolase
VECAKTLVNTLSGDMEMATVKFTQMKDGTREDYQLLHGLETQYIRNLPERLLDALGRLGHSLQGYQVSRLEHSLQTASRAEDDGASMEYIVAALLHDLGDELGPENHSQVAAAIVRPYVSAEVTWVIEMHGLFQMKYYAHHYGLDRDGYLRHRDHPWFEACNRFCERWDQAAFDPAYKSRPLAHFEPMLRQVFSRKPFDPAILKEPGR